MITRTNANNHVIKFLEADKHTNLNILGYLDYDRRADIYLYGGDMEKGVIIGSAEQDFFFVATENQYFIDEFWKSLPSGFKIFSAVPAQTALIFEQSYGFAWCNPCKAYVFTGKSEPFENSEYKHEALTADDIEEVYYYYTFKEEVPIDPIRENILTKDSSCIRVNGELAAWCMVHAEDGSMGPIYTKEEYRRLGLAKIITSRLIGKLLAKNIVPYVQIISDNAASLSMIKDFEMMEYSHDCVWFGIDKQP
ncbi:MAG: hypothetical protein FWE20_09020 [Defluviitaleaceae bacterium]|nr:hypothetical protein [Defluviitaleaceae bacterium]